MSSGVHPHTRARRAGAVIVFLVSAFDDDSAVAVYLFVSICVTSLVASLMLVRRDITHREKKNVPHKRDCSFTPDLSLRLYT